MKNFSSSRTQANELVYFISVKERRSY